MCTHTAKHRDLELSTCTANYAPTIVLGVVAAVAVVIGAIFAASRRD